MILTRDKAIELHRKMWSWIADTTKKEKRCVSKTEYFDEHNILWYPRNKCYCCEFTCGNCSLCPINWKSKMDKVMCENKLYYGDDKGFYAQWSSAYTKNDWKTAVKLARKLATLPEK